MSTCACVCLCLCMRVRICASLPPAECFYMTPDLSEAGKPLSLPAGLTSLPLLLGLGVR